MSREGTKDSKTAVPPYQWAVVVVSEGERVAAADEEVVVDPPVAAQSQQRGRRVGRGRLLHAIQQLHLPRRLLAPHAIPCL